MSTNTPKPPPVPYGYHANGFPIDVGPEHELVGEDEVITADMEALGQKDWRPVNSFVVGHTAAELNRSGNYNIIAIRRRKVVKGKKSASICKCGHELRQHFYYSHVTGGKTACSCNDCLCQKFNPDSDKTILEKGGDEKCSATVANASNKCPEERQQSQTAQSTVSHTQSSPAPEVTKGASIYTVAQAREKQVCRICGRLAQPYQNNPLILKGGQEYAHKLCLESEVTKMQPEREQHFAGQPSPEISQEKVGASPSQWIPVSELKLPIGTGIILGCWQGDRWVQSGMTYPEYSRSEDWTHFYQVPPPPKPQTQAEKDEGWIQSNFARYCGAQGNYQSWAQGCNAALAYARGEKGEK